MAPASVDGSEQAAVLVRDEGRDAEVLASARIGSKGAILGGSRGQLAVRHNLRQHLDALIEQHFIRLICRGPTAVVMHEVPSRTLDLRAHNVSAMLAGRDGKHLGSRTCLSPALGQVEVDILGIRLDCIAALYCRDRPLMLMLARMPANRAVDRRQLVGGTPDLATIEFWVASGQVQDALLLAGRGIGGDERVRLTRFNSLRHLVKLIRLGQVRG